MAQPERAVGAVPAEMVVAPDTVGGPVAGQPGLKAGGSGELAAPAGPSVAMEADLPSGESFGPFQAPRSLPLSAGVTEVEPFASSPVLNASPAPLDAAPSPVRAEPSAPFAKEVRPDVDPAGQPASGTGEAAAPAALDGNPPPQRRNPLRDGNPDDGPLRHSAGHGVGPGSKEPLARLAAKSHTSAPVGKGKMSDEPYDPIKENGEIFVDWDDPDLAIVLSGRQDGYLEPCGCAGLERMKGGLTRRYSFIEHLRKDRGWPLVVVDVGGQIDKFGAQAEMKFHSTVDAMRKMGYDAIGFGRSDLRLPAGALLSDAAPIDGEVLFVSANVAPYGFDTGMVATHEIIESGGLKVGVTSVLGKAYQAEINNAEIEMADPEKVLAELTPVLAKECDLLILLAHAETDESLALGRKFPDFNVVVTAGGPPEPPLTSQKIEGTDNLLIEVGQKGMYAAALGVYLSLDGTVKELRYQRVPLDSRFPSSVEMKNVMKGYQDLLRTVGFEGLGLRPAPRPDKELLGGYVGSKECATCHDISYDVWKDSGHAKAWETLVELDPSRTHDAECVSCHVVGWNPQLYFPYETGYWSEETTPHLVDVGCESCHGPGEAHVKAEAGSDLQLQEKLQKAMVITLEESRKRQCYTCHDGENSPGFDFDTYWPLIEHYEFPPDE